MTSVPQSTAQAAELLGDIRALADHLGQPTGVAMAALPPPLWTVTSAAALRQFLTIYCRDNLVSAEWPLILRAYELARQGMARELVALDAEWAANSVNREFAEASFRVGRRQLNRLRPLRDQRVIQKYIAAVEAGRAQGWHPLVYGVVLAVFNLPLRQGLVNYATQTLGGFADAAMQAHRLSENECTNIIDDLFATLPSALPVLPDTALFAS